MSTVIDVDLSKYFDTIQHPTLLEKIAKRVEDPEVMRLIKQILRAVGKIRVPQGGPFSPLAANIYLNEVDWFFDEVRKKTTQCAYEAVNYHRYADDIVITVSGHHTKRGWAERALQRLREQTGYFIMMTPKKKARKAIKEEIRKTIRIGGATPMKALVARINPKVAGWVEYFRVGHSSRAFAEIRDYLEMKIRTLLTRRKRRRKRSIGWRRWRNEYLYDVLGLYWGWKLSPLENPEAYR